MKYKKIDVFLPCRKGSERIKNKNIKRFHTFQHGLVENKVRQLLKCNLINNIYLSTNDFEIIEYIKKLNNNKIVLIIRDEHLCSAKTSTDQLISHVVDIINTENILWTHVTSPFVNENIYENMIKSYFDKIEQGYDSLMSVTPLHNFIWNNKKPINYDREKEKWPRTQTLTPLYDVNSAAFISNQENYSKLDDRIGNNPFLYELNRIESTDIDWVEDFVIAEQLAKLHL